MVGEILEAVSDASVTGVAGVHEVGEDGCVGCALHQGGDLADDVGRIEEPGEMEHVERGVVCHKRC